MQTLVPYVQVISILHHLHAFLLPTCDIQEEKHHEKKKKEKRN